MSYQPPRWDGAQREYRPFHAVSAASIRPKYTSTMPETAGLRVMWAFANYTGQPITIHSRQGEEFDLPSMPINPRALKKPNASIYFYKTVTGSVPHLQAYLDNLKGADGAFGDGERTAHLSAFRQAMDEQVDNGRYKLNELQRNLMSGKRDLTFRVIYEYPKDYLEHSEAGFYCREIDYHVTKAGAPVRHPYSPMLRDKVFMGESTFSRAHQGAFVMIKCVDNTPNEKRFGKRFINWAGTVVALPVAEDNELADGIHVYVQSGEGERRHEYYNLDQLHEADERYKLYRDEEAARYGGPLNEVHKQHLDLMTAQAKMEVARIEQELAAYKASTEKLKAEHERLRVELEQAKLQQSKEMLPLQEETARVNAIYAAKKAQAEESKAQANSVKEWASIIGTLIGLAGATYAAVKSFGD